VASVEGKIVIGDPVVSEQLTVNGEKKVSGFRFANPWGFGMMEGWNDGFLNYQRSSFPIFHFPVSSDT
jgi:hypothetical protein